MANLVSYSDRAEVRTALLHAGATQEEIDEIDDADIDILFNNKWKGKNVILKAQREDLVDVGVSRAAIGVIIGLQRGEQLSLAHP